MPRPVKFLTDEEKANKPKITIALLRRILAYLIPYWKQIILVLLTIIFASIFDLLPAVLTGKIVDEAIGMRNLNQLIIYVLLAMGAVVFSNLISLIENYLNSWIAQHISFDIRNKMFQHLQAMSHRFFTNNKQGDIITRMTSDISGIQSTFTNTYSSIIKNVIILLIAFIAMVRVNLVLALVAMAIVPLFSIPTKKVGKTRWTLTRESQACNDSINDILNETLSVSGQLLVKLFTNEEYEYARYEKFNSKIVKINIKESLAGRWFRAAMNIFSNIGPMLIYLVGGLLIINYDSSMSIGDLIVMVTLLDKMYRPVNTLMDIQVDIVRSMALFTRIFEYLDMPIEIVNKENAIQAEKLSGEIEFNNVRFEYENNKTILKNLSFKLEKGKSLAIVGPSGAGKSSIINLIPRLYDVSSGSISIDGIDLRDIDLRTLRKNIGIVTQDTYLFNGSIKDNLLYAKADATEDEMIEACKKANLHEFIMKQTKGYDTFVGNRGLKLSGGEKQRVSIARVILKDPSLLIFDEATSSLDSISEDLIQKAINPLMSGRTSIVIAHRLSTIKAANEIMVIKEGEIVEKGKHKDLLENKGLYNTLYETQFQFD